MSLDSRYMTYGVVDGKDPILTPAAKLTLCDLGYFAVESIFDLTKGNGKRGEYGNRAGKWTTLDAIVGLAHDFDLGDTLGALTVDDNYIYEYLRRHHSDMGDTQYVNLEFSLGDLWLEPTLAIERDLMADEGTYVNFEKKMWGHSPGNAVNRWGHTPPAFGESRRKRRKNMRYRGGIAGTHPAKRPRF